jgi:hypothetical protein
MPVQALIALHVHRNVTDSIAEFLQAEIKYQKIEAISKQADYQRSAELAGWKSVIDSDGNPCFHWVCEARNEEDLFYCTNWKELCSLKSLPIEYNSASEYVTVSEWLGGELAALGEMVAFDVLGTFVWARFPIHKNGNAQPLTPLDSDPALIFLGQRDNEQFI